MKFINALLFASLALPSAMGRLHKRDLEEAPAAPAGPAPKGLPTTVRIDIVFDDYPEETGWYIKRGGNILEEHPPGSFTSSGPHSRELDLYPGEYRFRMTDTYGDGICCDYGEGSFEIYAELSSGDKLLARHDGEFGNSVSKSIIVPS